MAVKYQKLPANTIRLLHLCPGAGNQSLQCTLVNADLEDCPEYEAMSYLWGLPNSREILRLNEEHVLNITESAASALRRVRLPAHVRTIWMDQICINQEDMAERSQQVSIMHRIYRGAARVLMYLGPDPDNLASAAKDFISDLQKRWETPVKFEYSFVDTLEAERLPAPSSIMWNAFRGLMGLQYFKRVWMLQEVMLSTEAVAFWGDEVEIPWLHIARAACWGESSVDLVGSGSNSLVLEEDCTMVKQMLASEDDEDRKLKWMVGLLSYRQATDPRDKIFAVMNLVSDTERLGFQADYTMETADVYKEAAQHIIFVLDQNLDILQNSTLTTSHPMFRGERWPSWVPRWGAIDYSYICGVHPGQYLPCDRLEFDAWIDAEDGDWLCAKGVEVGRIQHQARTDWHTAMERNEVLVFDDAWRLTRSYADPSLDDEPLVLQMIWTLLCCEADFPDSALDGFPGAEWQDAAEQTRREYAWTFIEFYLFNMLHHDIKRDNQDLLDAVVLANLGLLSEPFDRSNPEHVSKARIWKEEIRTRGIDPDVYESSRADYKRLVTGREPTEDELDTYACFVEAAWKYVQPVTYTRSGGYHWQAAFAECGERHRFFVTDDGRIGMASLEAQPGDVVAILFGSSVPFVLRPVTGGYLVVCSCYCYTIMRGQFVKKLKKGGRLRTATKTFVLH